MIFKKIWSSNFFF